LKSGVTEFGLLGWSDSCRLDEPSEVTHCRKGRWGLFVCIDRGPNFGPTAGGMVGAKAVSDNFVACQREQCSVLLVGCCPPAVLQ